MRDVLCLGITLVFFVVADLFVRGLERLAEDEEKS
jgi:hypothetical protein